MKFKKKYHIAIDGPAGAGKSTIAKLLAKRLKFLYVDSGAMYRAVTLYLIQNDLLNTSDNLLKKELKKIKIYFRTQRLNLSSQKIVLNGKDVSEKIRTSTISNLVSEVSAKKIIRKEMVKRQKEFGKNNSIVMDGRDIGTVVFPDSNLKIYLTASAKVRAERRMKDLKKIGEKVSLKKLINEIQMRDNYDSSRKISPLSKAHDAILIDCSNMNISEVLEEIEKFIF